jgi:hypothetical protein
MKPVILLITLVAILTMSASAQDASWTETFDKFSDYPYDASKNLPAPWVGGVSMYAQTKLGYEDTAVCVGPSAGWKWGHAFRSTRDTPRIGDAMVAKIYLHGNINYQGILLAFTTDTTPGPAGQFGGGASAVIHITGGKDKNYAALSGRTNDPSNKTIVDTVSAAPHPFLAAGVWYEVRLVLAENRTVMLSYRHAEMSYWIPVGSMNVHKDFRPNFIAISTLRGARVDDVGFCAAPLSAPTFTPEMPDDFDHFKNYNYTGWTDKNLPSPWENVADQYAHAKTGYKDTAGCGGPGANWTWGHAFKPTADKNNIRKGNTLVAKLRLGKGNTYQGARVGLTTDKSVADKANYFTGHKNALLHLMANKDGSKANLVFAVHNNKDADHQEDRRIYVSGSSKIYPLDVGVWYEVRMKVSGKYVSAQYKQADEKTWKKIGSLTVYDGFEPNYIAISCLRGGFLDDVGFVRHKFDY